MEFHNRQDPIGPSDCDVNGENMGGWWPQHSAADTGVKLTRHCPCSKCLICAVFGLVLVTHQCDDLPLFTSGHQLMNFTLTYYIIMIVQMDHIKFTY